MRDTAVLCFLQLASKRLRSGARQPVSSASYRAAGANVMSEPERAGPAELPETRKLYGTQ